MYRLKPDYLKMIKSRYIGRASILTKRPPNLAIRRSLVGFGLKSKVTCEEKGSIISVKNEVGITCDEQAENQSIALNSRFPLQSEPFEPVLSVPKLGAINSLYFGKNLHKLITICKYSPYIDTESNQKADFSYKHLALSSLCDFLIENAANSHLFSDKLEKILHVAWVNTYHIVSYINCKNVAQAFEPLYYEENLSCILAAHELLRRVIKLNPTLVLSNRKYIQGIICLFNTPDPKERDSLSNTLFCIYISCFPERDKICRMIYYNLIGNCYNQTHFGAHPSLSFLNQVVNFEGSQMSSEFLKQLSMLLHSLLSSSFLPKYYEQFSALFDSVIKYFPSFVMVILLKLLNLWPIGSVTKETLFFRILNKCINRIDGEIFSQYSKRIAQIWNSTFKCSNSRVIMQAIENWESKSFAPKLLDSSKIVIPIIYQSLQGVAQTNWNSCLRDKSANLLKLLNTLVSYPSDFNTIDDEPNPHIQSWTKIYNTATHKVGDFKDSTFHRKLRDVYSPSFCNRTTSFTTNIRPPSTLPSLKSLKIPKEL